MKTTLLFILLLAPFSFTRAQHLNPQFEAVVPRGQYHGIEYHVERDPALNQRVWELFQALHDDNREGYDNAISEPVDGERLITKPDRYKEHRKAVTAVSKGGYTVQMQLCTLIQPTGNHWYRFVAVPTIQSKPTYWFIVVFDVTKPGRPIVGFGSQPNKRRAHQHLASSHVYEEKEFGPRVK